ncbi:MAG: nuclear transport factor 2 family protein [Chloroflexi bacterium]|nr:nuclear transport factor 2 family protein [Chloroflexota bacterium]
MTDRQLQDLLDKQAIYEVLVRYTRGVDRLDREMILSCYHPDAFDDHGGYQGTAEGHIDWSFEVLAPFKLSNHRLGNLLIDIQGDTAYSECYVLPYLAGSDADGASTHQYFVLRFIDRFERRSGGPWLIAHRVLSFDWNRIDPVEVGRALTDDYIVGRRDKQDPVYQRPS